MYERFSDPARRAMNQAYEEARGLNHPYIGTEHILLAIASEQIGMARAILNSMKVDGDAIRAGVGRFVARGSEPTRRSLWPFRSRPPHVPSAKKAVELAMQEVHARGSSYLGTEHLLLGLAIVPNAVSTGVLNQLGVNFDSLSSLVAELHRAGQSESSQMAAR